MRSALALAAAFALAGCAGARVVPPAGPAPQPSARPAPPMQTAPPPAGFRAPRVMNAPGLEAVIGRSARALEAALGTPALRVGEGDAAKLQWRGRVCVLDVYLYPLRPGAEPTATHVEARRASDGQEVDRAACVQALSRR